MTDKFTKYQRTNYNTELTAKDIGNTVILYGWVQKQRNLGSLIFIDLRDRTGIIQVAFDENTEPEVFEKARTIRNEYVLAVTGVVRPRAEGAVNTKMATGEIEVFANKLEILNVSETPPIYIEENSDVKESLRLKYRYLDLRRPDLQRNLLIRHKAMQCIRRYFDGKGFLEIETPVLTKSTPEGARDYVVPSRVQDGKFYALPQSPQLMKQLLMIAGYDRYFQIVKCFRDEDLRADRQPEFTQVDVELSFADEDYIMTMAENMVSTLIKEINGRDIKLPLPRMTYKEAMEQYGSDKPDTRFGMKLKDISDKAAGCAFPVFADTVKAGGYVRCFCAEGCASFTRKEIDSLTEIAKTYKAKGMAWLAYGADGNIKSSFNKFLNDSDKAMYIEASGAKPGDLICFVADKYDTSCEALGQVRLEIGRRLGLLDPNADALLWVTQFPMLEWSEDDGRWYAKHHPFTMPYEEDLVYAKSDPGRMRSAAYDIVWNGYEAGGGSLRIHDRELQKRIFSILGFTEEEAENKFGYFFEAFKYGAPPHGGFAMGLDRLIMLLTGTLNIRDVIAFPKVQTASCLMSEAPSYLDQKQLDELHIAVVDDDKNDK